MKQKKCRFSHRLNAFSDGELSKHEFEKVQNHLKECPACQAELREIVSINSFLSSYQEEEVPEYLNQRILATVQDLEQTKVKFGFPRQIVNFSVAASVFIAFAAGIFLSDIAFNKAYADTTTSELDFGQNSLYSYFDGGE
jgi:anti-sigma factor RsiW